MIQLMGRFSRLSGKLPSQVIMLTLAGSIDEIVSAVLLRRLKEQGTFFESGISEDNLTKGLGGSTEPEDDMSWLDELREAAENKIANDGYR